MKLTADTITDEQIRELRVQLLKESGNQMTYDTDACGMAFCDEPAFRALAREYCAEIWNARHEDGAE